MATKKTKEQEKQEKVLGALDSFHKLKEILQTEFPSCRDLVEANFACQKKALAGVMDQQDGRKCERTAEDLIFCVGNNRCGSELEIFAKCTEGKKTTRPPLYCMKDFEKFNECMSNTMFGVMERHKLTMRPSPLVKTPPQ